MTGAGSGSSDKQMQQLLLLGGLLLLVFLLWNTPVILPLKILTVFFHESAHALATVITGGKVDEMVVVAQQGGYVMSVGGNRFITLSAGYLGSLLIGIGIYMTAARMKTDRITMAVLGGAVIMITFIFVTNVFARGFGLATAVAMLLSAKYLSERINDLILRVIGLTSIVYAPLDIVSDTLLSSCTSDARMMAREFGGTTALWGISWIVISVVIIFLTARWTMKLPRKTLP